MDKSEQKQGNIYLGIEVRSWNIVDAIFQSAHVYRKREKTDSEFINAFDVLNEGKVTIYWKVFLEWEDGIKPWWRNENDDCQWAEKENCIIDFLRIVNEGDEGKKTKTDATVESGNGMRVYEKRAKDCEDGDEN